MRAPCKRNRIILVSILFFGVAGLGCWWWRQPIRLHEVQRVEITNDHYVCNGGFYAQGAMYGWNGQVLWRPAPEPYSGTNSMVYEIRNVMRKDYNCRLRKTTRDPIRLSPNGEYMVRVVDLAKRYRIQTFRHGMLLGELLVPPGSERFFWDCRAAENSRVIVQNDGSVWLQTDLDNPHSLYLIRNNRILASCKLPSGCQVSPDARYIIQYVSGGGYYSTLSLHQGQIKLNKRFFIPLRPEEGIRVFNDGVAIAGKDMLYRSTGRVGKVPIDVLSIGWPDTTWYAYAHGDLLQVHCPSTGDVWQCHTFGQCYGGTVTQDGRYAALLIKRSASTAFHQVVQLVERLSPSLGKKLQQNDRLIYALYERPGRLRALYYAKPDTALFGDVYPTPDGRGMLIEERVRGNDWPDFVLLRR